MTHVKRDAQVLLRLTRAEKLQFTFVADWNGLSLSGWIRDRLLRSARLETPAPVEWQKWVGDADTEG